MIGFDRNELCSTNTNDKSCYNSCAACITFSIILIALSAFMFANKTLPSKEIIDGLITKKVEYVKGYFDNNNLIPTWQKR